MQVLALISELIYNIDASGCILPLFFSWSPTYFWKIREKRMDVEMKNCYLVKGKDIIHGANVDDHLKGDRHKERFMQNS